MSLGIKTKTINLQNGSSMINPPLRNTTTYVNDPNEDLPNTGRTHKVLHFLFGWMFKPHEPLKKNITDDDIIMPSLLYPTVTAMGLVTRSVNSILRPLTRNITYKDPSVLNSEKADEALDRLIKRHDEYTASSSKYLREMYNKLNKL